LLPFWIIGPALLAAHKEELMMTTSNERVDRLQDLKEHLKDQGSTVLLEPLLTTADLEALLKVDRRTLNRLVKRGEIPVPMKLGGSNRWRQAELARAIDQLGHRVGRKLVPVQGSTE
jgi:predicted DNA-binding transcriptional regulator AlpA